MSDSEQILKIIKQEAIKMLPDGNVILFGSQAKNNAVKDSDYDVLIVLKTSMEVRMKMYYKAMLRKILVKSGILSDIFIESEEEVKIKRRLPGHIIKTAITEGIVI